MKKILVIFSNIILKHKVLVSFVGLMAIVTYGNFFSSSYTWSLYSIYNDLSDLYFLHGLEDISLFPYDLVVDSFMHQLNGLNILSGFMYLYLPLLRFFPLFIVAKFVSIVVFLSAAFCIFRIGQNIHDKDYGLVLSWIFTIYFLTTDIFFAGAPRGFGGLLVCIFFLFFSERRFILLVFFPLAALFFYPPVFPLLSTLLFLIILFYKRHIGKKYMFFLTIVVLVLFFSVFVCLRDHLPAAVLSGIKDFHAYKFILDVKRPVDPSNLWHIFLYLIINFNEHGELYSIFTLILAVLILFSFAFNRTYLKNLPGWTKLLFFSSLISFIILLPWHPNLAARQFAFSAPFIFVLFTGEITRILQKKIKISPFCFLFVLTVVFILFHPIYNNTDDFGKLRPIHEFFENQPPGIIIAGHPKSQVLRSIPLFTKRGIMLSERQRDLRILAKVYQSKNESMQSESIQAFFYARNRSDAMAWKSRFTADFMIVEEKFYKNAPHLSWIWSTAPAVSLAEGVFQGDIVYVIDLRKGSRLWGLPGKSF